MIGIVILNYNDWENAVNCINSISEKDLNYKIYFVDNCSIRDEEKLELIRSKAAKVILLNKNNGYSAGNNIGISAAKSDGCRNILISNTDIIFTPGAVSELKKIIDKKNYAIAAPRVKVTDFLYQEIILGVHVNRWNKLMLMLRGTIFGFLVKDYAEKFACTAKINDDYIDVYGVSGCCFLMSEEAVNVCHPLDENIFLYNEEYVVAHKMLRKNLKSCLTNKSVVYHLGGESTKKIASLTYKYFIESEQILLKKYYESGVVFNLFVYILRLAKPLSQILNGGLKINQFISIYMRK